MIKALVFDCFGVLATDIWLAFCDGLPPTADLSRARDLNKAFDRGMISQAEFMEGVREATGQTPPDLQEMELTKNTALLEYIADLAKDYKIGLLSNVSNDWVTSSFLTSEERQLFTDMVLSYEVGLLKPDAEIYQLMCERLGVEPHEAVMIDDREPYVTAAQETGMHGVTYQDIHQLKAQLSELLT